MSDEGFNNSDDDHFPPIGDVNQAVLAELV